jgi:cob(I)alamin adenosyltransferase
VCRRAERSLVALGAQENLRGELFRYVNRLSDLLFVLARYANHTAGVEDIPWKGQGD